MNERAPKSSDSSQWHSDSSGMLTREIPLEERRINVGFTIALIKRFEEEGQTALASVLFETILDVLVRNGRLEEAQQLRDAMNEE